MKTKTEALNAQAFRCIEQMLAHIHPRQDVKPIVETLRSRFGTVNAMFSADAHVLEKAGLHPHDALLLSCIPDIARYVERSSFDKNYRLDRIDNAGKYLIANFYGYQVEYFYMLHLDARGKLIERTLLQEGMPDCSLFNLKKLLSEVMRVSPKAVILSHNHPGCTLRPSQEDINCTNEAIRALSVIGIPMLDHIIVAGKQAVSLRENGFIPAARWLSQAPDHKMLQNFLLKPGEKPPARKTDK